MCIKKAMISKFYFQISKKNHFIKQVSSYSPSTGQNHQATYYNQHSLNELKLQKPANTDVIHKLQERLINPLIFKKIENATYRKLHIFCWELWRKIRPCEWLLYISPKFCRTAKNMRKRKFCRTAKNMRKRNLIMNE